MNMHGALSIITSCLEGHYEVPGTFSCIPGWENLVFRQRVHEEWVCSSETLGLTVGSFLIPFV